MPAPKHSFEVLSDLYFSLKREKFPQIVLAIFVAVLVAALLMTFVESSPKAMLEQEQGFFDRLATAIYYGVVTITTVGYGDYSPQTAGGRFLAVVLMLFGMVILGLLHVPFPLLLPGFLILAPIGSFIIWRHRNTVEEV